MNRTINLTVVTKTSDRQLFLVESTKNVSDPIPGAVIDEVEMRRLVANRFHDVNIRKQRRLPAGSAGRLI